MKKSNLVVTIILIMTFLSCSAQNETEGVKQNTMDLKTEMKNEFEEIIDYFKSKGEMHAITEANTRMNNTKYGLTLNFGEVLTTMVQEQC